MKRILDAAYILNSIVIALVTISASAGEPLFKRLIKGAEGPIATVIPWKGGPEIVIAVDQCDEKFCKQLKIAEKGSSVASWVLLEDEVFSTGVGEPKVITRDGLVSIELWFPCGPLDEKGARIPNESCGASQRVVSFFPLADRSKALIVHRVTCAEQNCEEITVWNYVPSRANKQSSFSKLYGDKFGFGFPIEWKSLKVPGGFDLEIVVRHFVKVVKESRLDIGKKVRIPFRSGKEPEVRVLFDRIK